MDKSKKDKKKYSGFPGDCSQEQLQNLAKFKEIVKGHNNGSMDIRWDDVYLLRFLRARKFVLKDVEKMWVNFIEWRQKMHVDQLDKYYFPELAGLRKLYPHGYHKFDKQYRPIYIERVGMTIPEEIFKLTSDQRLLSYYAMSYEVLLDKIFDACTEQRKKQTGQEGRIMQTCTILDLKHIKLSNTSSAYKFVKPASEMAQNNYPEILGNMFIINAPFLFTGIWAIVKMWIDEKTKQKIKILGGSYKKQLLEYINPENLPDFIDGGKCKCQGGDCLSINIGPWNIEGKQLFPNCFEQKKKQVMIKEEIKQQTKKQTKEQTKEQKKEEPQPEEVMKQIEVEIKVQEVEKKQ